MKLGAMVMFDKHYVKTGEYADMDNLTPEQSVEYDENGHVTICKWKDELIKSQVGYICGARNLVISNRIDTDYNPESGKYHHCACADTRERVYLIATNMNGFHRVKKDWITAYNG